MASVTAMVADPLPPRLMRFFAKYPPRAYSAHFTGVTIPTFKQKIAIQGNKKSNQITDVAPQPTPVDEIITSPDSLQIESEIHPTPTIPSKADRGPTNPFLPYKNHTTGRWRGPAFGLRTQADLVKLAKQYGVEPLLPPGPKSTVFKEQRILERGLRVKGTGEGQKVKGHKWERTMASTLQKRVKAMEEMPEMIRLWEQKGHGRGWKKYPSGKKSK